ncbi:MAG TPA: FAD-dependent oxidoreductase [Candidatus Acidoferrales bacterium]|nr:FAD-dependent oxidoreductase [Candidatus Acidoferrales bacterium]
MANPVIVAVDDDPQVLRAVERDLRRRFGHEYRIVAAESGPSALDAARRLSLRGTPVALYLADQRMPGMTGTEFLEAARDIFPDAKRVLLTAYADTEVAIQAINSIRLDHYLLKPWDPPEEKLYPVLEDLLGDWQAAYVPPFDGLRLVSHRWVARSHEIKDYLARNQIPYRWLDVETDPEAVSLVASAGEGEGREPLLVFPDGSHLVEPSNLQIAEKVGLRTQAALPFYDLVIVGGGPAGLAAAVYGASEGLRTLLVEQEAPGGQAGTTSRIENYLGFPSGLSGSDLARRALAQASRLGAEILTPQAVVGMSVNDPYKLVQLSDGSAVSCQALLVATGVEYRRLDVPGLDVLTGAGVFYGAATTEAPFYRGQHVAVVGGGNSAGQAAVYLARYAEDVLLVVRGATVEAGMSQYLVDRIGATPNIRVLLRSSVVAVHGNQALEAVEVATGDQARQRFEAAAMFVFIGQQPRTDWLGDAVERDQAGFVLSGPALSRTGNQPVRWPLRREPLLLETSVPGVFVAGDVRSGSVKRIASSVGEGSMAVQFIHQYLATL